MKRIAYTAGEPAGIGVDLAILHACKPQPHSYQFVAITDPDIIVERAQLLGRDICLKEVDLEAAPTASKVGELAYISIDKQAPVAPGKLNTDNASYVLASLDHAINGCLTHKYHAMVTGPVQKSVINDAGIAFSGHTEYLAQQTNTSKVVMLLATEGLKVALVTTHIPLTDVASSISSELLTEITQILHRDLQQKFAIPNPTILVCGLNPHAGEGGHLGREEIDTIIPTLKKLQETGIDCQGPLPADTLFTPKYLDNADAVLAMYHDQGLPVLKHKGFGAAANITLGLPIIRTSVDHGTALDLAGTGRIDTGSLDTAIDYALNMHSGTQDSQ